MLIFGFVLFLVLAIGFSFIFSSAVIGPIAALLVICFGLYLDRKVYKSKDVPIRTKQGLRTALLYIAISATVSMAMYLIYGNALLSASLFLASSLTAIYTEVKGHLRMAKILQKKGVYMKKSLIVLLGFVFAAAIGYAAAYATSMF